MALKNFLVGKQIYRVVTLGVVSNQIPGLSVTFCLFCGGVYCGPKKIHVGYSGAKRHNPSHANRSTHYIYLCTKKVILHVSLQQAHCLLPKAWVLKPPSQVICALTFNYEILICQCAFC